MELERAFARGWTGPRQTIVTVALCNRDNGKSKFLFLFWESIRTVDDVSMWFYDLNNDAVHQVTLPAIQESLSELLFFNSVRKGTETDNSQFKESRACLAYLLFVQLITIDSFPAVFRWDENPKIWSRWWCTFTTRRGDDAYFFTITCDKQFTLYRLLLFQSRVHSSVQHGTRQSTT